MFRHEPLVLAVSPLPRRGWCSQVFGRGEILHSLSGSIRTYSRPKLAVLTLKMWAGNDATYRHANFRVEYCVKEGAERGAGDTASGAE